MLSKWLSAYPLFIETISQLTYISGDTKLNGIYKPCIAITDQSGLPHLNGQIEISGMGFEKKEIEKNNQD